MDEEKLSGVLEWPVLTKVKQVQAFLGFANFYRRFIENFAKMSKLLSNLTKKDCTWNWGVEQQNAFEALKKAFTMAPVLRIPNDEDPSYHKWSLTICDGCFDTLKSSKMRS